MLEKGNTMEQPSRHYVLVDFENTQQLEPQNLSGCPAKLVIFIGNTQKHISTDLVKRLFQCQCTVELFESAGAGKNALDFQMAFYAGRVFEREPKASLHIVSRDKGFDPLVTHLREHQRCCSRVDSFHLLPFLASSESKPQKAKTTVSALSPDERRLSAIKRLTNMSPNTRPRKVKTLASSLSSQFSKQLTEAEIKTLIDELIQKGNVLVGENDCVSYQL